MANPFGNTDYDHIVLADAVEKYTQLEEVTQSPNREYWLDSFQWKIDNWRRGEYKLVVVGEINKGKSSFINALLGCEDLAPVAARVASSVPIKIVYGAEPRFRVHFLLNDPDNPDKKQPPREISPDELEQYATESGTGNFELNSDDGNRDNRYGVDFISIEYPNELLEQGLTIVDLPGLGGVHRRHTRLVQEYLHPRRADHIVYILDSTGNPLSSEEEATIRMLRKRKMDRFLFVQTKTDAAGMEKSEIYRKTNLEKISVLLDQPEEDIPYFSLSSHLKLKAVSSGNAALLGASKFEALEKYLFEVLIPAKRDNLADGMVLDLKHRVVEITDSLVEKRRIFQAQSVEELNVLSAQTQAVEEEFREWRTVKFVEIQKTVNENLEEAKRNSSREFQNRIDFDQVAESKLVRLERSQPTARQVVDKSDDIWSDVQDEVLGSAQEISDDYQVECEKVISDAAKQLEQSITESQLQDEWMNKGIDRVGMRSAEVNSRITERLGRISIGMSTGGIGAGIGIGLVSIAIPVVGLVAVAAGALTALATFFGAKKANDDYEQAQGEKAASKLRRNLQSVFRKLKNKIQNKLEDQYRLVNAEITRQLVVAIEGKTETLQSNVKACEERKKASDESIKVELARLDARVKAVREVDELLEASLPESEPAVSAPAA